jgi:hypothetical protein
MPDLIISQEFYSNYPFRSIHFRMYKVQKHLLAELEIRSRTYLALPVLISFTTYPNAVRGGGNSIIIEFDLSTYPNTVSLFFETIENNIPPPKDNSLDIFEAFKANVLNAVHVFCQHYEPRIPEPKFLQVNPSSNTPIVDEDSILGREMYQAIRIKDPILLQEMLAKGANPNISQYQISMINLAVSGLGDYNIRLLLGKPSDQRLKELPSLTNRYTVMVTKESDVYQLYWRVNENFESIQIKGEDIFLSEVIRVTFTKGDGSLIEDGYPRYAEITKEDRIKLSNIVRPYLENTLGEYRIKDANLILKMVILLMEYGADPGRRVTYSDGVEFQTAVEAIVVISEYVGLNDFTKQKLLQELIRLTLRFDRDLYVSTDYENHFLGKFILAGQRALANENNIPQELTYKLVNEEPQLALDIFNNKTQRLRLKVFSLEEFERCHQERQQVIELCKEDSSFPWKRTMTEEEFEQYINDKLKPLKTEAKDKASFGETIADLIDILYNEENQVVCFSISRTVVYKEEDKASQYHVRLIAIDRSIRDQFPKIAFRLFFYRSMLLKSYYNKDVTTSFTSASAASYLLLSGIKNYPKYTEVLEDTDWQEISTYFLAARLPNPECQSRCMHFTSKLFYEMPSALNIRVYSEEMTPGTPLTPTGISLEFYNSFLNILGHSTLVVIHSDAATIIMLNQKIPSSVENPLTFFSEKARPLNEKYLPSPTDTNTALTFFPMQDEAYSPPSVGSSCSPSIEYTAPP